MAETRFAYKPKTHVMLLAAVFFLVASVVLIYAGATNDRGLILNHIIEMDEASATTFYYVLAGLSAAMTAGGVFGFVMSLRGAKFVVLDDASVEFPGNLGQKQVRIPYGAITGLQPGGAHRQRWVYILHAGGRHAIMGSMLANPAQLDEIASLIAARIRS
ncbi:MAG: hypothetical protein ABMA14_05510 [Hyphomonadaceae bacterium]